MKKKLNLSQLSKNALKSRELSEVKGGSCCTCGCGCYWAGSGGSSTAMNGHFNTNEGIASGGTVVSKPR